ncbi:MAG TPA: hypothetical protein VL523_06380, partial [Terriglobia bacterium]|nr:hypothetical protein [Terriglobia bacterium]
SQKGGGADATKKAAVKLLVWLSTHPSHAGGHDLKPFPLLCEDGQLRTFADVHEAFLLPSQFLCEGEREWAKLLPDYVRLSEVYVQCCDSLKVDTTTLCQFLKGRRLASASLIFETTAAFSSELVAALQPVTTAGAGHRIDALNAKDVAGLTRLLSDTAGASASGDWLHAQSVFRFVLGWLVPNDNSWKATIRCQCSARQQHGCEGTVAVYPCQWLGKLKTNPWIPGGGSGGSCQTLNADTAKLLLGRVSAEIIESTEARKFLSMHCGVDALELAIRAAAGGDLEKEVELRGQWAQAVDLAQPSELVEFVNRRRSASEINTRNGALGRIVEELVKAAFRREGFDVERTGVGSDFRATIATGADPNWEREDVGNLPFEARLQGRVFNFLVEVKATKEDSVRMSWIQGDTAARNSDGYVLCVVDFGSEKGLYHQVLSEDEPTCGLIAKCIRVAPRIGEHLAGAVRNLSTAAASSEPGIEVEKADEIRFRILRQVWLTGEELGVWARTVRDQLISR